MKEGRLLGPRSVLILPLLLVFAIGARPTAAQVSAWTEGNTIRYRIDKIPAPNGDDSYCVVEITLSDGRSTAYGTAPPCNYTPAQNSAFYCNKTGSYVLSAWARSPTAPAYFMGQTSVTVADPPPATCPQFEVVAPTTKILTHKYDDGATYPNGQIEDGKVPIKVIPRVAPAGTVVHLRLYDPPDSSVYGGPHDWNDNFDPAAGMIDGDKTTQVTLPDTGAVDVLLEVTDFATGDNYEIHYSTDAALLTDDPANCTAPACRRSSRLTAWKRMYVETRRMWRLTTPLTDAVVPGDDVVYVDSKSGFHKGNPVTLIHASSFARTHPNDASGFYAEERVITHIGKSKDPAKTGAWAITLDAPLAHFYFTEAIGAVNLSDAIANRAAGIQSGGPAYSVDGRYLVPLFADAFVDVVASEGAGGATVPHYEAMTEQQMVFVGNKWFSARSSPATPPNHGLAVAASTRAPLPAPTKEVSLGSTIDVFSFVWIQTIRDHSSGPKSKYPNLSGADPVLVGAEVLAHEMAHQWNVNPTGTEGHCTKGSHLDVGKACLMNSPTPAGQIDDGYVAFHYAADAPTGASSEYLDVRKAPEPRP